MRRKTVAVIGASQASPEEVAMAEEVGQMLAQEGLTLITGGLGGVMSAASKGARAAQGLVIGILPQADPDAANPDVEISIASGINDARNAIIANSADLFVAVGGGFGGVPPVGNQIGRLLRQAQPWQEGEEVDHDDHHDRPCKWFVRAVL